MPPLSSNKHLCKAQSYMCWMASLNRVANALSSSSRLERATLHYSKPRAEALAHPAAPLIPPGLLFREQGLRGAAGDELHQLKASHQGLYLIMAQAASPLGGE